MPAREGKPLVSLSMGCAPHQVKQFNEHYKRHGIKCAYHREDGVLELTSNRSRNEVMKLRSFMDKDGGFSQYAGK